MSLKSQHLLDLIRAQGLLLESPLQYQSISLDGLRDRLDFSFRDGKMGLYDKNKHFIVDIQTCSQLSPALQSWLTEFKSYEFPLERASLRLRVSPDGKKGLWIDAANIDIKKLLEETSFLHKMQSLCEVEIGQRRKKPFWNGSEFKLKDPEQQHWFNSWAENTPIPLFCQIASFTQVGHQANKVICDLVSEIIKKCAAQNVIEFGAGIGNLTFASAPYCRKIVACEIDKLALKGLEQSLEALPEELKYLRECIEIHAGDFQRRIQTDFSKFDCILANPPRSGLMSFTDSLQNLPAPKRPGNFIYMSCFPETFVQDAKKLETLGYQIKELKIMDQFPQTEHYEVLSLFERIERNA